MKKNKTNFFSTVFHVLLFTFLFMTYACSSHADKEKDPNGTGGDYVNTGECHGNESASILDACGCSQEAKVTTHQNMKACVGKLGKTKFIYMPLKNGEKPVQLAVFLHGDGGIVPKDPTEVRVGLHDLIKMTQASNTLLVLPEAHELKHSNQGNIIPSWAKVNDVEELSNFLNMFIRAYDLPRDKVLIASQSGGSWYMANEFIHKAAGEFQGAWHVSCGGGMPSSVKGCAKTLIHLPIDEVEEQYKDARLKCEATPEHFSWDYTSQAILDKLDITFQYGSKERDQVSTHQAFIYYQNAGLPIKEHIDEEQDGILLKNEEGVDECLPFTSHCNFSLATAVRTWCKHAVQDSEYCQNLPENYYPVHNPYRECELPEE